MIRGFVLRVLEYCSAVWCSAADTHLKLLDRAVGGARFLTGVCLSETLLIVDLLLFCVCWIRSGATRCVSLTMRYLYRMCQCGLHAVPWSNVGIFMRQLTAVPRISVWLLFHSQCPSGTILLTSYSMVWDWRVSRAGPLLFYWPKLLYPSYSLLLFFPFSSSCI